MDFLAFDTVVGYLTAFMGIIFSLSIFFRPERNPTQTVLALFICNISVALTAQSLFIEMQNSIYHTTALFLFSLTPITFSIMMRILWGTKKNKLSVFEFYALTSLMVGAVLALILWGVQIYMASGVFATPVQLTTFAVLISLYTLTRIYFVHDSFNWTALLKELLALVALSTITSGVLFLGGVTVISQSQFYSASGLIFTCLLVATSVYRQVFFASINATDVEQKNQWLDKTFLYHHEPEMPVAPKLTENKRQPRLRLLHVDKSLENENP